MKKNIEKQTFENSEKEIVAYLFFKFKDRIYHKKLLFKRNHQNLIEYFVFFDLPIDIYS
jgi:hypothetical protein